VKASVAVGRAAEMAAASVAVERTIGFFITFLVGFIYLSMRLILLTAIILCSWI